MTFNQKVRPLWSNFTYFEHQIDGIQWMLDKEINGTIVKGRTSGSTAHIHGGFQCDDMGLGKTIQITSVIVNNPVPDTLLIVPLVMIQTWSEVLQRAGIKVYLPQITTSIPRNTWLLQNKDSGIPRHFIKMRPAVYIANYEKLYHNPSLFRREWNRVVLDEAHKIRNYDGEVARYARKIVAPLRWVVTGTPLVNSFKDVVSLLAFLGVPHSKLCTWETRYEEILPQLVIHRTLESLRDVIPGAPPVPVEQHEVLSFDTKHEEEFYLGVQGATEQLLKKYSMDSLTAQQAFVLLLRLRQISVHPQVYINAKRRSDTSYLRDDWALETTKLNRIRNIILNDTPFKSDGTSHKYIVFCQFTDEIQLIKMFLEQNKVVQNIFVYNGAMTKESKDRVMEDAREAIGSTVVLVNLMSGNAGLNMQFCDRIIFTSGWWSDAVLQQAKARAVRIGQKEIVHIFLLSLAIEQDNSINIDRLIHDKAHHKQIMLEKIFHMCSTS